VGLERGSLSLMSTIEELLGRNSSSFSLEIREYGHGDPSFWPCDTLYPQELTLISPTSGSHSVSVVSSSTKAMAFVCLSVCVFCNMLMKPVCIACNMSMKTDCISALQCINEACFCALQHVS
jgi:hypothetical protein